MSMDLTLAIGGSIEAAIVPYHVARLRHSNPELRVHCVLSPGALQFVTPIALQGISGCPVHTEQDRFTADGLPAHIADAGRAVTVIYPATARIIAQMALGVISCPVTRLFAFCDKRRAIVTPYLHPAMEKSLYEPHLQTLQAIGCHVVQPREEAVWQQESAWIATERALRDMLGLHRADAAAPTLRLSEAASRTAP